MQTAVGHKFAGGGATPDVHPRGRDGFSGQEAAASGAISDDDREANRMTRPMAGERKQKALASNGLPKRRSGHQFLQATQPITIQGTDKIRVAPGGDRRSLDRVRNVVKSSSVPRPGRCGVEDQIRIVNALLKHKRGNPEIRPWAIYPGHLGVRMDLHSWEGVIESDWFDWGELAELLGVELRPARKPVVSAWRRELARRRACS